MKGSVLKEELVLLRMRSQPAEDRTTTVRLISVKGPGEYPSSTIREAPRSVKSRRETKSEQT